MNSDIVFHTVSMRNFKSYGNNTTTVNLHRPGVTTMITAEMLDLQGGNNGAGKTSILDALCFAWFDRIIDEDVSKDALINNLNKKNMEVTSVCNIGNFWYKIHRGRKMKEHGGNFVKLFRNTENAFSQEHEISQSGVVNAQVEQILGMPFELFTRIVVYSATTIPFLNMPTRHATKPSQQGLIEFILRLTVLSQYVEDLKEITKGDEQKSKILINVAEQQKKQHEFHMLSVQDTTRDVELWYAKLEQDVINGTAAIEQLSKIDFTSQKNSMEEVAAFKTAQLELKRELDSLVKDMARSQQERTKLQVQVQHMLNDQCPFCERDYKDPIKLSQLQTALAELSVIHASMDEQRIEKSNTLSQLMIEISEMQSKLVAPSADALFKMEKQSALLNQHLESIAAAQNPHQIALDKLKASTPGLPDYAEINQLVSDVEHSKFLVKLLNDSDSFIRKSLLEDHLPYLNARLQSYVTEMGLPHSVYFNHHLEVEITQFGNPLAFGSLSNGQKSRVNLALSIAFRDMLQKLHNKVNICVLDEVLDIGLDAQGVERAVKLLKKKSREESTGFFVISHRSEIDGALDKKITVRMERGFSSILE